MGVDQAIEAEAQAQAICMQTEDFARAYRAFAAKREAGFRRELMPDTTFLLTGASSTRPTAPWRLISKAWSRSEIAPLADEREGTTWTPPPASTCGGSGRRRLGCRPTAYMRRPAPDRTPVPSA